MAKEKTKEDIMLEQLSIEDINEAIKLLQEKCKVKQKEMQGMGLYTCDKTQRFQKDFAIAQARLDTAKKELKILLKHINKLKQRLAILENKPVPSLTEGMDNVSKKLIDNSALTDVVG